MFTPRLWFSVGDDVISAITSFRADLWNHSNNSSFVVKKPAVQLLLSQCLVYSLSDTSQDPDTWSQLVLVQVYASPALSQFADHMFGSMPSQYLIHHLARTQIQFGVLEFQAT